MKTKLIANRDFTDKNGQKHKAGDKLELDQQDAQEVIQRGEAKEDHQSSQQQKP